MAGKSLGTLTIDLIAKVGGFVAGMGQAERASEEWRRTVEKNVKVVAGALATVALAAGSAAIAAGTAGISLLRTTSKQIDETDKLAKSLKMSTQDLLAWQFAAEEAGIAGDKIADIFKDIGDKIGDAILNKSGGAVDSLNALGLSAKKLSEVSPDKQLLAIGEGLQKIKNNSEKINILESLGSDLSKLLPLFENNNEKLKESIELAKQYGIAPDPAAIDDLLKINEIFEDMEKQAAGLKMELAAGLAKVDLSALTDSLDDFRETITDPRILQGLSDIVSWVVNIGAEIIKSAGEFAQFIKYMGEVSDRFSAGGWAQYNIQKSVSVRSSSLMSDISTISNPVPKPQPALKSFSLGRGETNGKPETNSDAKKLESAYKATELAYMRQIALTDQLTGKTKEATELEKIRFDISTGKLVGINQAQQDRLEGLAAEIDKMKVLEKYKDLQKDMLTPEEKLVELTRQRVGLLKQAKEAGLTNDNDYRKTAEAISNNAFTEAPEFEGIDPLFSGQSGELRKIDEAQKDLEDWYAKQLEMLDEYRQTQSDLNAEWDAKELELKKKHDDELQLINDQRNQLMLSSITDGLGSMVELTRTAFGEQSGIYKAAFIAQKAAAIAQSMIAIQQGIAMAAANPFPYNLAAMATVASATAGIVSNIAAVGMAHDGIDSVPETGTWLLQKGERVTTASTSAKLDATLDRVVSQTDNSRGQQITQQIAVNGNPDDRTLLLIEDAAKRGAQMGYQMVTQDVSTGRGQVSKALGGGWSTKRRTA